jgi:hypothetical protein
MGSPTDLLDELARVYARVAVDEFLARTKDGLAEEDSANRKDQDSSVEPPSESEAPK